MSTVTPGRAIRKCVLSACVGLIKGAPATAPDAIPYNTVDGGVETLILRYSHGFATGCVVRSNWQELPDPIGNCWDGLPVLAEYAYKAFEQV